MLSILIPNQEGNQKWNTNTNNRVSEIKFLGTPTYYHGSHIFRLTNFPNFSSTFFSIFQYLFSVSFNEFNK